MLTGGKRLMHVRQGNIAACCNQPGQFNLNTLQFHNQSQRLPCGKTRYFVPTATSRAVQLEQATVPQPIAQAPLWQDTLATCLRLRCTLSPSISRRNRWPLALRNVGQQPFLGNTGSHWWVSDDLYSAFAVRSSTRLCSGCVKLDCVVASVGCSPYSTNRPNSHSSIPKEYPRSSSPSAGSNPAHE